PGAFRILKSVVIEEMLHLSLARNMITAIGRDIRFCDEKFIPKYPYPVPMRQPELKLTLGKLTKDLARDVFMEFEKPSPRRQKAEATQAGGSASEEYATIGQFYQAIHDGFKLLCGVDKNHPNGDPNKINELFKNNRVDLQYVDTYWNEGGGGKPILVTGLPSALIAINTIVEQGEGMSSDRQKVPIYDPGTGEETPYFEYPHYVKLERIAKGWEPIGETYTVPDNPKIEFYPEGKIKNLGLLCNAAYTYVLRLLDELYRTSWKAVKPGNKDDKRYGLERTFIAAMQGLLFGTAKQLVRTPIDEGRYVGFNAAPTFEWYNNFPQDEPMTDHLMELCNKVVPHFPELGGDNSVLWLIEKMPPLKPHPTPAIQHTP
ncbi:MAG: ferritin-like domain-containing protein, partial [Pseudonocardiaceae bacterium]